MPTLFNSNTTTTNTSSTTVANIWFLWVNTNTVTSTAVTNIWDCWAQTIVNQQLTREQRLEFERQQLESRARYEREAKERVQKEKEANERAETLLLECLSVDQVAEYRRNKFFIVQGGKSGKKYRIRQGRSNNIDLLDGERITHRLCCHPGAFLPAPDNMLAQKVLLELQEEEFVRTANIHAV